MFKRQLVMPSPCMLNDVVNGPRFEKFEWSFELRPFVNFSMAILSLDSDFLSPDYGPLGSDHKRYLNLCCDNTDTQHNRFAN